jgi:hypothetical protein
MRLVGYCRLSIRQQEPIFKLSHKSREMTMNWLFEAYSNVYNTAMGQRPLHHETRGRTTAQRCMFERTGVKTDM